MELADHAHMEGRNATQGFHENRPVFQQLVNKKLGDELQPRAQIRNKSKAQLLEQKSSWQRCWQTFDIPGLSAVWQLIWQIVLWVALGTLVIMVKMVISAKADSTGQQIY